MVVDKYPLLEGDVISVVGKSVETTVEKSVVN